MASFERLVLFDIDGTLINNTGHAVVFSQAFKQVYGVNADVNLINHHGMTDQQIIVEVLKKVELCEDEIHSRLNECMTTMASYFWQIKDSIQVKILDGVCMLLDRLERESSLLGLVTGNIERIGKGKLERAGLARYFKVGGFGSDDASRTELVRLAVKRAEENYNFIFNENTFLFGDTPKDIIAGNEARVFTVGVATGIYSRDELHRAGANYIFDNLMDTERITRILRE